MIKIINAEIRRDMPLSDSFTPFMRYSLICINTDLTKGLNKIR